MRNNKSLKIVIVLLMLSHLFIYTQEVERRYNVYGIIKDARTHKIIKNIPFTVMPYNRKINTDKKGAFLLNLPKGKISIIIDYYPFDKEDIQLNIISDTTLNIQLKSPFVSQYIEEVEIYSSKKASETPLSLLQIDKQAFKTLPAMIGERDILKALALGSGVTSSSEGAADMQVRGGTHGQNLYLLDGIPLYSTQHLFGLISAYNPSIVKKAQLYKADFPSEFGGKISSVVNVISEDANLTKYKGEAEISILASKLALNIPLAKNKLALTVAGRISNYSLINIFSFITQKTSSSSFALHFGDLNANLLWKLSDNDKLKLTFMSNTDGIDTKLESNKSWVDNYQQNLGLNWYKIISSKTENHLFIYADKFGNDFGNVYVDDFNNKSTSQRLSGINSVGITEKLNYKFSDKLSLNTGASIKSVGFSPFQVNINDSSSNKITVSNQTILLDAGVYGESLYQFDKNQTLRVGLRLSSIGNKSKFYTNIEPRLSYNRIFVNDFALNASISKMTQPIHRVANSGLGYPFEMFFPSSESLKPESSWIYSIGGSKDWSWNKRNLSLSIDAWYKIMENIVDFQDGYDSQIIPTIIPQNQIFTNTSKFLVQGNGKSYGVDVTAKYNYKGFRLGLDYTLMQARNQFNDLNNGKPFAAPTDMRNNITLNANFKLNESCSFTAVWQYHTGRYITLPTYIFKDPTIINQYNNGFEVPANYQQVITERNNYRTKPFHRLDVSFNHNYKTHKKHLDASISLGIYNVYNQANPFIYYIDAVQNSDKTYTPVLKSMSLFPILPSFSWSVKF